MQIGNFILPTIWKQIQGFPNYKISTCGQVCNVKTNRILKLSKNNKGYNYVDLRDNNQRKCYKIHRLVALHFLPNINNDKFIDHKNGNRDDNTISNLRFCSNQENCHNTSLSKVNTSGVKGVFF